eukprot:TRINITY_DN5571_c0_g1_i1.p1 TRINITY_DN5571_c0_g1~~TRINITY_DN5571_c0_g1_i1.p1  ORF type:complete len:513 (-),score=135.50 TRINITY_DN5571_c0_g1_i1:26-1564(-)
MSTTAGTAILLPLKPQFTYRTLALLPDTLASIKVIQWKTELHYFKRSYERPLLLAFQDFLNGREKQRREANRTQRLISRVRSRLDKKFEPVYDPRFNVPALRYRAEVLPPEVLDNQPPRWELENLLDNFRLPHPAKEFLTLLKDEPEFRREYIQHLASFIANDSDFDLEQRINNAMSGLEGKNLSIDAKTEIYENVLKDVLQLPDDLEVEAMENDGEYKPLKPRYILEREYEQEMVEEKALIEEELEEGIIDKIEDPIELTRFRMESSTDEEELKERDKRRTSHFAPPEKGDSPTDTKQRHLLDPKRIPLLFSRIVERTKPPIHHFEKKSTLRVYLPFLNLPPPVLKRLKTLAGKRYNSSKDIVTLVSRHKSSSLENSIDLRKRLQRLITESYVASRDFVPLSDLTREPLSTSSTATLDHFPPHKTVDLDSKFDSYDRHVDRFYNLPDVDLSTPYPDPKVPNPSRFTLFRLMALPPVGVMEQRKLRTNQLVQHVLETPHNDYFQSTLPSSQS